MKLAFNHAIAAIILVMSFAGSVAAGPLEDADVAVKRRDYATAVRLIRPLWHGIGQRRTTLLVLGAWTLACSASLCAARASSAAARLAKRERVLLRAAIPPNWSICNAAAARRGPGLRLQSVGR
jgi:hypothetical protein